ncbi:hypothetical protein WME73_28385 [Sorangium sp. So ce302]|uniref:hypothetical protein n=1 Tax=Sorangium sp. So ce302 TaxID=3133297 RepID=UPI003F622693
MIPAARELSAPRPARTRTRSRRAPSEPEPTPPSAPPLGRRFALHPLHAIGAFALACVAASALFMHALETREATAQGLTLRVAYPERMRFRDMERITFDVENTAGEPCRAAALTLDEAYLDSFEEHHTTPAEAAFGRFALGDLAPGERRRIDIELRGERSWLASGNATLSCGGERGVHVPLRTFIFP